MKKALVGIIFLGLMVSFAMAQSSNSTRPRVAPTPVPPTLGNDTVSKSPGGPPVLQGGRNVPSPRPEATATPDIFDENEVIKVETNLVTMPVSVLDRDGRFISGLRQQDFKIFENGVEQKVDYFQSVEQPFTVVLLIDVSPSTQFRIDEIQQAAITFVDKLRPADRVMVISFDQNVNVLCPPTNNRYQLRDAIRQAQFGDGTGLYEAVDYAINQELRQLEVALPQARDLLRPGGRLVVIAFHSLEDRIVKRFLRAQETPDELPKRLPLRADQLPQPLLRSIGKAVRPSEREVGANPRARSAVMRVAEKL